MNLESRQPAEPVIQRRERDRRLREEDFLAAAERLFGERGFRDASMEEIAHEAGYATGTIYRYFASKQALFGELLHRRLADYYDVVKAALDAAPDPREKFLAIVRVKVRFFVMNQAFLRIYVGSTDPLAGLPVASTEPQLEVRQRFLDLQEEVLRGAVEAGIIAPEHAAWTGAGLIGLTNGVMMAALSGGEPVDEQAVTDFMIRAMEKGLWKA